MSDASKFEGATARNSVIPTVDEFKKRMNYILLNNRYTADFGGSKFWNTYNYVTRYMVSSISFPQMVIDNEQIYVGGAGTMVPNGFTQNNLELVLYNTGPELQIMQQWMTMTYNQNTRTYGYFEDIRCDLRVVQYTVDGVAIQTFTFTDCTLYNIGGLQFGYEPASAPQTFSISLNYFGYNLETNPKYFSQLYTNQTAKTIAAAAASVKK